MSDDFVTIGRFSVLSEAQAAGNRLEGENIRTWIIDDSVGGSLPGLGDTIGGIILQVHEADYERADAVLAQALGDDQQDAPADDVAADEADGDDDEPAGQTENSVGRVVTSRGVRRVVVGLLVGPTLIAYALFVLALIVLLAVAVVSRLR